MARVYDYEGEVPELLAEFERDVLSISNQKTDGCPSIKELAKQSLEAIQTAYESGAKITGIRTGLDDLDKLTDGLHAGEVTIIAAFPSVGKTTLAMNIAEHAALVGNLPVGIFSLEMTGLSLTTRMICSNARLNLRAFRDGFSFDRDFKALNSAVVRIGNAPIHINDIAGLSIHQLRAKARRMTKEHKIRLWIIDYLQLLNAIGGRRRMDNKEQELAEISNNVKAMAKELNAPVLALSQLNDDGKLKHCRTIGEDADNIWKLETEGNEPEADGKFCEAEPVKLWIRKQRNGPRDVCVKLVLKKTYTKFESASKVSDEEADARRPYAE